METRAALERLIAGEDLLTAEVRALFGRLMDGELEEIEKAALLVALAAKRESPGEIVGAVQAMRARLVPIPHALPQVVDTCGTGGDGTGTFNISTAAALVAAAAGATVAKHGNRSVSSRSGSADVLEELGVSLELEPQVAARCLEEVGIAFLFAPRLHPAMREVMPVRRALGVRTIFNLLGPLTNPAGARRQVIGVWAEELVEPIAEVLAQLGAERALVVHGEGLDEITTTGTTVAAVVEDGTVQTTRWDPSRFGIEEQPLAALTGGSAEENARSMESLLAGGEERLQSVVAVNAAAALWAGGVASSLEEGFEAAREALASGAAAEKLEALRSFSS